MPRLWNETIEAHRHAVIEATLDTTAALVASHGLRAVTMSKIAEETGIGRATLYKYFPDIESILRAWHERQIADHLNQLEKVSRQDASPGQRLETVLQAYSRIAQGAHGQSDAELAAFLHRDPTVDRAHQRLHTMIRDLLREAAAAGNVRTDIAADELVTYCLSALEAANHLPSQAAARRLVAIVLSGLRPQADP